MKGIFLPLFACLILFLLPMGLIAQAPPLGSASSFGLFTSVGAVTNIGATQIVGDLGLNAGALTGVPLPAVTGQTHVMDAVSIQAASDVATAYAALSGVPCGQVLGVTIGNNQTLTPNTYCQGAASTISGDLILDAQGDPNALFIFKIDAALATGLSSRILLTNGASLCNVYWQINGAVSFGLNSVFRGTILATGALNFASGASLIGRGLTRAGAINLMSNTITVAVKPVAAVITANGPTSFCAGGSVILSGNNGGVWNTGATTPSITVTAPGDYFVTNTANCGSVNSNHIIVTVNPLPAAVAGNNAAICAGGSVTLGSAPIAGHTYLWTPASGLSASTVANPIASPSVTTTYTLTETITASGCQKSNSVTVTVNPLPNCTITGNFSLCSGQSSQLCVPAGSASYLWSTGAITNCITVNTAGNYSVTVTNASGCTSVCSQAVTVGALTTCNITGNPNLCPGQSTQLCVPAGAASYLWSTGATTNCITVNAAGNYSVTVTNAGGCTSVCSQIVAVTPLPNCTITGNFSLCSGQSSQLCVPAGSASYLWSTGAITNCITVNTAGNYSVTVTNASGCTSVCSQAVTVGALTTCNITGNPNLCPGQSTQLCVPAGAASYLWSTGATTNCITVNAAGNYSVTVTNAGGCTSVCSQIVAVTPLPNCTITGNFSLCSGQSSQLCVPAGSASYLWSTGAITNCITVNTAGNYSVTVTNASGCTSVCSQAVTVGALTTCNITGNPNLCPGQSTQLCVPAGAASYLWSTGATTNCITVNAAGNYSVTVTNAGGCTSVCSQIVTVTPLPNCTITGNFSLCSGQSSQLCVPAGSASYLWSTGAITNCITVNTAGNYSVTVTNASGCTSVCSQAVTVGALTTCNITGNPNLCPGQSTQLCVPAGAASYLWSTGATTNCITVNAAGNYSVTVTNGGGCTSVCSQIVTVTPLPNCTITGNFSLCSGQSSQLCVPAGSASYLWSTGAITNCITVSTAGNYSVTVTNASGCTSVCSQAVTVGVLTTCSITGNAIISQGQTTQLCVPSGAASYLWSTGATTNCITVSMAGNYSVTVTNGGGCTSVCSLIVTVNPPPTCLITGNPNICAGQSTQLCASAGARSYLWSTGATTNCITVSLAGNYSVTVTNTDGSISVCSQAVTVGALTTCNITGNPNLCPGQSTQLCVPAGAATYLWSTGATTNCITVNAAGNYSVTVTNGGGCTSVCSQIVTVTPLPNCTITGNFSLCSGQSSQLCVPAGSASYLWSTGATTNCITVNTAGIYSVTVTNTSGCASVCSQAVTVGALTTCSITGNPNICPGQSTQLCVPAGAATYLWSTGATTNCITVNAAGNYSVTVTNGGGCTSVCSQIVTVTPLPNCMITGNFSLCSGQSSQLCVPAGSASYLWSTGATTNCITVSTAGNYSVTVTNTSGCASVCSQAVTVGALTTCSITGNPNICPGQSTQLCVPAGAASYLWSTGATTNCITVNAAGNYSVTVTNGGGCTSVCSQIVTVTPLPNCTITGNFSLCSGQSSQLCVPAGSASYLWSTGATTNCITVSTAGIYSVTVTNTSGCASVCSQAVTVGALTTCSITGNPNICPGQSTQLCVPAGAASYLWSTGATTNCITVNAAGNYSVTVTNGGGCTSVCSQIVTVTPLPNCTITGNFSLCSGQSSQLCVPAGSASYLWSTGATTNCITVSTAGNYSVTVTNASGCPSICSQAVTVGALTTCSITGNPNICPGQSTQLCVPAGAASYLWSTGATTNCITVNAAGNYSVTVTNGGGCTSVCSQAVTFGALTSCTITGNPNICPGQSTQLCVPTGAASYLWSTGATTNCITVNAAGNYSVTVANAGGCTSVCSQMVTVTPLPNCTITGNFSLCSGQSSQLCVPAGSASYLWSTGATTNCITVNTAGNYSVTVANASGCTSICSQAVTIGTQGACLITPGSPIICPGQSTQLCAAAGLGSYLWNTGATTNCITVNAAGTYSLTVTNGNGCVSTCSQTVSSLTTCTLTGNPIICPGQSAQLCAPVGFATYLWSTGATTNCIAVSAAGNYCVTVTTGNGCVLISSRTVTIASLLSTAVTISNPSCQGGNGSVSVQVFGGIAPYTYLWSTGSTASSLSSLNAGKYSVTVTDSLGCTATQTVVLTQSTTIAIALTSTAAGACNTATGSATATASGGAAPYKYVWSNGRLGASINNVAAGTYTVTVTDANNCSSTGTVTVAGPASTLACAIAATISCAATSDGVLQALATGGAAPYSYKWNNGATVQTLTGVAEGNYSVVITDANGCTTTCSATLTAAAACDNITNPGIISGSQTFCPQTEAVTGISSVQLATGGSGTIEYMWMRSTYNAVFNENDYTAVPNANSPFLTAAQVGDITEVTYFARCVRRACCAKFIETNVVVKRPSVLLPASFPYDLCAGRAYVFEAPDNGPNATFNWNFGAGATPATSTARKVSVIYNTVGNYPLTLRTSNNGCNGIQTVNISVNNLGCQPGYGSFAFTGFNVSMTAAKMVMVDWATANENSGQSAFFVQRSANGKDFKDIKETPAAGGKNNLYHFMDQTPTHGRSFYRIRNTALSGGVVYSGVLQNILTNQAGQSVLVYPNPATTILYVEILDQENAEGVMELINAAGQTVFTKTFSKDQPRYDVSLQNMAEGIYLVKIRLADGTLHTVKMMKMN